MTPENFCYWLQGFSEIAQCNPTPSQWTIVQDHLDLIFKKVTPDRKVDGFHMLYQKFPSGQIPWNPNEQNAPYLTGNTFQCGEPSRSLYAQTGHSFPLIKTLISC